MSMICIRKIPLSIYKAIVKLLAGHRLRRFFPVRVINEFIISLLKLNYSEIQGHKMFLDPNGTLGLIFNDIYEPFETKIVKDLVKKGDVVLDLGANIGYYTLIFAKLVGDNGKVFAFEPDPKNFALLSKNVELNRYRNVTLVQKAVTNKSGKIKLYLSKDNTEAHRTFDLHDGSEYIEAESIRLDDYFKNYNGKIDFIKMDIEGSEGMAICGMLNLLNKNVKIVTEFNPYYIKKSGIDPEKYLRTLVECGFKLYHINEKAKKIEKVNIKKLLEIYNSESEIYTNILCVNEKYILDKYTAV